MSTSLIEMKDRATALLQKALANPAADFRAGQWDCIEGILRSQRQLVVQKTGWGKSMVYFRRAPLAGPG